MASEEEMQNCFDLFDKANTKTITAAQAGEALRTLGKAPSQAELKDLLEGKAVDFPTFKALASKLSCPTKEEVIEAFSVFDMQGNGYIALKELTLVLKSLGEGLEDDILAKLSSISAPDVDNQVNYRHLIDVMMNDM